ncbi:MAG: cupin domain-containing protein [Geobacter sp.]|nr:cupin domain-containing protein [Geobacter sp.]
MMLSGNLLANLPDATTSEQFELLAQVRGVRVERIVSQGQATPAGQWYDQDWYEWVLLLQGEALVQLEDESTPRHLGPGDCISLPPRCRHRVQWTPPNRVTVWLALHIPVDTEEGV